MVSPRLTAALCLWSLMGHGLSAQEVVVEVPPGEDELRGVIERDSLTFTLSDVAPGSAQDYVAAARSDYRRILTGLYSLGHYGGTISILIDGREAAGIAPLDAPETIDQIRIVVEPGPPFTFGQTVVAPLASDTELPEGFATGQPARSDVIGVAVRAGVEGWRDIGHAKAQPGDQQITALHDASRLDVSVALDPGPALTFGTLTVQGNVDVRSERIIAIAGLPTGKTYSPQQVQDALDRLRRAGPFQSVVITEAEEISPGNTLDFAVQVSEMKPRRLNFGAEFSSLDGLNLTGFWLHRNLLGGAEQLKLEGEIRGINAGVAALDSKTGGTDATLQLTFGRPGTLRADTDMEIALIAAQLDEPFYFLQFVGAGVGLTRYVSQSLTYEGQVAFATVHEETDFRTRDYTLMTLPTNAELDRRDDPLDARRGYYVKIEATPFIGIVGGDDGIRLYADNRIYRSFGRRVTLAARGQIGSLIGADPLEAPADYLFYSGGSDTVRGQAFESLGVSVDTVDDDGNPITVFTGGTSFLGAQLEARIGITDAISVVGFYDAGYVDSSPFPTDQGEFQAGAGIGIRYDTPIGPIRLDLATPAYGDESGRGFEFYLGIGQAF